MATTVKEKHCSICGSDVSQQKRVKDTAGNYYCEPCAQKTRQRQQSATNIAPTSSAPPESPLPPPLLPPASPLSHLRYTITGTASATGEETSLELEAASEKEAVATAKGRGILVTTCKPCKKVLAVQKSQDDVSLGAGPATPPRSSRWDRFLRGGLLGILDERYCVSRAQLKVLGSTRQQKGIRIAVIAGITVAGFAILIFGVILIGDLTSKKPSSISASSGERTDEQPRHPARNTYAVKMFMDYWQKGPEFVDFAAKQLDPRAIGAVRTVVYDTAVESFDGRTDFLGDNTITIFETGEQIQCQEFEVTPVVKMTDSLHMPISYKISVANDSKKVIAVVPSRM